LGCIWLFLEPPHFVFGFCDQHTYPNNFGDVIIIPANCAAVRLEHGLLVRIGRGVGEPIIPPIGEAGNHPQQILFA